jgi:molybdopterin-guanine dinucleotide biosynthesis protein A
VSALTSTTGVVLAGGRSKRFGTDKLIAPYRGAPLIHRPVRALAALGDEVVVVCAPGGDDLPLPGDVPVRVVRDAVLDEGPLAGVIAGLAEVHTATALIVAGDMPELQVAVLRTMLRTMNEPGVQAVWLVDGEPRPFPLAVRTAPAATTARRLFDAGERRLRALPTELGARALEESVWTALDPGRLTMRDVDEPSDLAGLPDGGV